MLAKENLITIKLTIDSFVEYTLIAIHLKIQLFVALCHPKQKHCA